MKQVALFAGVSQATVSLSLANHPRIPEATRDRIRALAQKVGYEPNPLVSALMRSRRRGKPLSGRPILAFVCTYEAADGWRNSPSLTLRRIHEGALAQVQARGYAAQEVWVPRGGMSDERLSEMLYTRGILGVLIGPLGPNRPPPRLNWDVFSSVRVGVPRNDIPLRCVCHDNFNGAVTAVQECVKLGYRRPGLILLRRSSANLQRRWDAGFCAATDELPPARRIPPWICDDWPDAAAMSEWLDRRRPDVLITADHEAVSRALKAAGRRVPNDLGLVSLACPDRSSPVAGICQNGKEIGAAAADLLVDLVERHVRGIPEVATALMIEGSWNSGQTVRVGPIDS